MRPFHTWLTWSALSTTCTAAKLALARPDILPHMADPPAYTGPPLASKVSAAASVPAELLYLSKAPLRGVAQLPDPAEPF